MTILQVIPVRKEKATLMFVLVLILSGIIGSLLMIPNTLAQASTTVTHICVKISKGDMRRVGPTEDCKNNERRIHLVPATPSGDVGIQKSAPGESLDVFGNIHASGNFISGNTTNYGDGFITMSDGTNLSIDNNTLYIDNGGNLVAIGTAAPEATLHIKDVGSTKPALYIEGGNSSEGDITWKSSEHLQIGRWNPDTDTFTEDMRIKNNGDVGIGTTNPSKKLTVRDNNHQIAIVDKDNGNKTWSMTTIQGISGFGIYEDASTGRFVITAGGNVGIGTLDPNSRFMLQGSGVIDNFFKLKRSDNNHALRITTPYGSPAVVKFQVSQNDSNYTTAMSMVTKTGGASTKGDVGIGTTDPRAKFHVSGGNGSVEMKLEADKNNSGESNQPRMTFIQDGGVVTGQIGYFSSTNNFEMKNNFGGARVILKGNGDVCIGSGC